MALTDFGTVGGLVKFNKEAKKAGINRILGVEFLIRDHLGDHGNAVFLAEGSQGFTNLCRLITESDHQSKSLAPEQIYEYRDNLVCIAATPDAFKAMSRIMEREDLYGNLSPYREDSSFNSRMINLTKRLVVTPDSYMPDSSYLVVQNIVAANANWKKTKESVNRFTVPRYLMSLEEMVKMTVAHIPDLSKMDLLAAIKRTEEIGERCKNPDLKFKDQIVNYPHLLHPLNPDGCSKEDLIRRIVDKNGRIDFLREGCRERFEYEMDTIIHNDRVDLSDYFLVLEDVIRYCRDNNIPVGPGRGSGAGSLVLYGLGITMLDPIEHGLLFERFISKGRIEKGSLPDVDIDFADQETVRNYLVELYGEERVRSIGTYQTIATRGSLMDAFRHLRPDVNMKQIEDIKKMIDPDLKLEKIPDYLDYQIAEKEDLRDALRPYGDVVDVIPKMVGLNRQAGIHPCFGANAKLFTSEGFKTFKELAGRVVEIVTPSGWAKAKVFKQSEKKELFQHDIRTSSYSRSYHYLECTEDHQWLCEGSFISLSEEKSLDLKNHNDFDELYLLLGWVWNDGLYSEKFDVIYLNQTPGKDRELFDLSILKDFDSNKRKFSLRKELSHHLMGIEYDKSRVINKSFPETYNQWTAKQKLSFLRGFMSANGFVQRGRLRLKLTSQALVVSLKDAFADFGISFSNLCCNEGKVVAFSNGDYKCRDSYAIESDYHSTRLFFNIIGFVQTYKNDQILNHKPCSLKGKMSLGLKDVYDFTVIDGNDPAGLVNGYWAHNCGLAITQDNLDEFLPLRRTKDRSAIEFDGDDCEALGIIKYDVLGLRTLLYIQGCFDFIREERDKQIGNLIGMDEKAIDEMYPTLMEHIPMDDKRTFQAFSKGDTESVFQFNSDVAKSILTKVEVRSLQDLSLITSVGRPGPMKNLQHHSFIRRKNGEGHCNPPHPALQEALEDTYGIMIYQESVMKAAQIMGGFTLAEADDVRKAMGKKKPEVLEPYRKKFVQGCLQKYPDTASIIKVDNHGEIEQVRWADHLWHLMETFSGYGFNRAHSMSYALIGYYCQYLKVHHPVEWWCACLMHAKDSEDLRKFYSAARRYVWTPSVTYGHRDYFIDHSCDGGQDENGDDMYGIILMPPHAIKGVGEKVSESIHKAGPFESFEDFFNKVNKRIVHKNVMKSLIFSGFFQAFENDSVKLINQYYELRKEPLPEEFENLKSWDLTQLKHQFLHFLPQDYRQMYPAFFNDCVSYKGLSKRSANDHVTLVGKIMSVTEKTSKRGTQFANVRLQNDGQDLFTKLWTEELNLYKRKLVKGWVVKIKGYVNKWNGRTDVVITNMQTMQELMEERNG